MLNNQDTPITRSHVPDPELATTTAHAERIMQNRAYPLFLTTYCHVELTNKAAPDLKASLEAAFEADFEGPPPKPTA